MTNTRVIKHCLHVDINRVIAMYVISRTDTGEQVYRFVFWEQKSLCMLVEMFFLCPRVGILGYQNVY